jgi:hypothetical protein
MSKQIESTDPESTTDSGGLQDSVVMYRWTFGEADGPFCCEHNGDCMAECWSIYVACTEDVLPSIKKAELLDGLGVALCDNHKPPAWIPATGAIANFI